MNSGCGFRGGYRFFFLLLTSLSALVWAGDEAPILRAEIPWGNQGGPSPVIISAQSPVDAVLSLTIVRNTDQATATLTLAANRQLTTTVLLPQERDSRQVRVSWSDAAGHRGSCTATSVGKARDRIRTVSSDAGRLLSKVQAPLTGTLAHFKDMVAPLPVALLPDRWQAYPTELEIILAADAERQLSPAQREALSAWCRAGGLLVVEDAAQADAWRRTGVPVEVFAAGSMEALVRPLSTMDTAQPLPGGFIPGLPLGVLLLIALVFTLVVGPANLWWVRRQQRRHLLFITTPVISLVVCVIMLVGDLAARGVTPLRRAAQLTIIDHVHQQATTSTRLALFGGVIGRRLELDSDCALIRLGQEEDHSYRRTSQEERGHAFAWGDRLEASGDWMPARSLRHLEIRQQRPERSRLLLERKPEGMLLTNGLAVGITSIHVEDDQGRVWVGKKLAPGTQDRLSPLPEGKSPLAIMPGCGALADRAEVRLGRAWTYRARLAAPLTALPGPEAKDVEAPQAWIMGRLAMEGTP